MSASADKSTILVAGDAGFAGSHEGYVLDSARPEQGVSDVKPAAVLHCAEFVCVKNLADRHLRAVGRALLAGRSFEVFNLEVGRGTSLNPIVDAARRVTGSERPVSYSDCRRGDLPRADRLADRAGAARGWMPVSTDVDLVIGHG